MARIDAQLQSDAANIFNGGELDETVTYQNAGAANPVSVSCHITTGTEIYNDGMESNPYKMDTVLIATDDFPSGSPLCIKNGDAPDEIVINGATWYVFDVVNEDAGFTELRIVDSIRAFAE